MKSFRRSCSLLMLLVCSLLGISNCENNHVGTDEIYVPGQVAISFEDNIDYDIAKVFLVENNYDILNLNYWYRVFIDKSLKEEVLVNLDSDSTIRAFTCEGDQLFDLKELSVINFETKGVYSFNHYYELVIKYSALSFEYVWYGRALIGVTIGEELQQAKILESFGWCRSARPLYLSDW